MIILPGCRTGLSFSCSQLRAHTIPSTVLAGEKAWHQVHLCKETTNAAPVTLALKGYLEWLCPNTIRHGHWWSESPHGSCAKVESLALRFLCLTFHGHFSFLLGLNQAQVSALPWLGTTAQRCQSRANQPTSEKAWHNRVRMKCIRNARSPTPDGFSVPQAPLSRRMAVQRPAGGPQPPGLG